jgi:hypothetical protein
MLWPVRKVDEVVRTDGCAQRLRWSLDVLAVDVVPFGVESSRLHTWASCQGLDVLLSLSAPPLACSHWPAQICSGYWPTNWTRCGRMVALGSRFSACSHTRSQTTVTALLLSQPGPPFVFVLVAEAGLNLRTRLATTAAEQVHRPSDSPVCTLAVSRVKPKRPDPVPCLRHVNAASPYAGVFLVEHGHASKRVVSCHLSGVQ